MDRQVAGKASLVIYHTPGCGRCQAAKDFFEARGFQVQMLDVAGDFANLRRMARRAKGARTVPVLELGEEVFVGFDPDYWRRRLQEAP